MARSFEENVKQWVYGKLDRLRQSGSIERFCVDRDQSGLDIEIGDALRVAPSKSGNGGGGEPDSQAMLVVDGDQLPVVFEFKGAKGKLAKHTSNGMVELFDTKHDRSWKTIGSYAVNGAVYYTSQIIKRVTKFEYILAVGVNGYDDGNGIVYEIGCYALSKDDSELPVHLGDYDDLSFLSPAIVQKLVNDAFASPEEIEMRPLDEERRYRTVLNDLNQNLRDTESIAVSQRVDLVVACIMAALGSSDVKPLAIDELKGSDESGFTDGAVLVKKARNYLESRGLPTRKVNQVANALSMTLENGTLETVSPDTNETPIKSTYKIIKKEIVPLLDGVTLMGVAPIPPPGSSPSPAPPRSARRPPCR